MTRTIYGLTAAALMVTGMPNDAFGKARPGHQRPLRQPSAMDKATLKQRLNTQVPTDIPFRSSAGDNVEIGRYFDGQKPVIVALGYEACPNLCSLVHNSLIKSLKQLSLNMGTDFRVLSVSIDPDEPIDLTRSARQRYLQSYGRDGARGGWHSLVGPKHSIDRLADAIGFGYAYDAKRDEYAHPGVLILLTPNGKISRYFYGVSYPPNDLKLGLVDASNGAIGSPVDKLLLRCCSYDPDTGAYNVVIMKVIRIAGGATVLLVGLGLLVAFRQHLPRPWPNRPDH